MLWLDAAFTVAVWLMLALPMRYSSVSSMTSGSVVEAPWPFLLGTLQVLTLFWQRRRVVPAAVVLVGLCLGQLTLGMGLIPANLVVLPMLYSLARRAPRWASFGGLGFSLFGAIAVSALTVHADPGLFVLNTLLISASATAAWLLGRLNRQRALAIEQVRDRAERLEREREQERALAQADERARIAREMHDIVAHSLSVIIAQADGARYASDANPEVARATLGTIAEQGRNALGEMRRLLGVLRIEDAPSTDPTPGLADIDQTVESARTAGLPTSYEVRGNQRRQLPAGAELVAFRVVQEALTNAVKHAGAGASASVELRWRPSGLELDIRDDGRGSASRVIPQEHPGGQGLRGMRERLALYGGTLAAGPVSGGGFRVRADIPYEERS